MATTTTPAAIISTPLRAQLHGTLDAIALLDDAATAANQAWCDDDTAAEDDTTHPLYLVWQTAEHATEILRDTLDAIREALRDSDEPRAWGLSECPAETGGPYTTIMATSADEALTTARDNVDRANYPIDDEGGPGGTIWIDIRVRCDETGETASDTIQLDEPAPDCIDGQDHDWQSPYEVLGGLRENPGVWGKGAGIIAREVCRHCGTYRVIDTWAQRRDTGEQGLETVTYEPSDDDSRAWVRAQADEA